MSVCSASKHKYAIHESAEKLQVMLYLLHPSLTKSRH